MKTLKTVLISILIITSLSSCSIMGATWASNQKINNDFNETESYAELNYSTSIVTFKNNI